MGGNKSIPIVYANWIVQSPNDLALRIITLANNGYLMGHRFRESCRGFMIHNHRTHCQKTTVLFARWKRISSGISRQATFSWWQNLMKALIWYEKKIHHNLVFWVIKRLFPPVKSFYLHLILSKTGLVVWAITRKSLQNRLVIR